MLNASIPAHKQSQPVGKVHSLWEKFFLYIYLLLGPLLNYCIQRFISWNKVTKTKPGKIGGNYWFMQVCRGLLSHPVTSCLRDAKRRKRKGRAGISEGTAGSYTIDPCRVKMILKTTALGQSFNSLSTDSASLFLFPAALCSSSLWWLTHF